MHIFARWLSLIGRKLARDQQGATATETAFVMAMIILICLGAISAMGIANRDVWQFIADQLNGAIS